MPRSKKPELLGITIANLYGYLLQPVAQESRRLVARIRPPASRDPGNAAASFCSEFRPPTARLARRSRRVCTTPTRNGSAPSPEAETCSSKPAGLRLARVSRRDCARHVRVTERFRFSVPLLSVDVRSLSEEGFQHFKRAAVEPLPASVANENT